MELPSGFVEEIDYSEISFHEIVGRGAFGVVSRAKWRDIDVAVKLIETESEKKAFVTELKQLSRVNHVNIVKLYGASTKHPVFLVMEYAEGGSLYNVLHCNGALPLYTISHALSWCLQCAKGVDYLHAMKPKPLVHRDLKPPNLLLISGGMKLKICDFGTACDAHTHMTNNKGSAAWMAPEVFEGSSYSEKCDVFSWGIILWEVLSRRKPFDEIGGPAFRIMWAVHHGTRPPLLQNCPKPIETLMTRCWSSSPKHRPSMSEVVKIMTHISKFFPSNMEPLQYPVDSLENFFNEEDDECDLRDIETMSSFPKETAGDQMWTTTSHNVTNNFSVPPDLSTLHIYEEANAVKSSSQEANMQIDAETNSSLINTTVENLAQDEKNSQGFNTVANGVQGWTGEQFNMIDSSNYLNSQLQPIPPCSSCPESMEMYQQYCQLLEHFFRMQTEISALQQRRSELASQLQQSEKEIMTNTKIMGEYHKLKYENDDLKALYASLSSQLVEQKKLKKR